LQSKKALSSNPFRIMKLFFWLVRPHHPPVGSSSSLIINNPLDIDLPLKSYVRCQG
jgi:hypothetical protein